MKTTIEVLKIAGLIILMLLMVVGGYYIDFQYRKWVVKSAIEESREAVEASE